MGKRGNAMWLDDERITVWSWLGLIFMAITSIAMVCCTVWMFM